MDKKFHIGLFHTSTKTKNAITIYCVYFSIFSANFKEIIFTILNQSSGGKGIMLNTANVIFIIENCIKKLVINQKFQVMIFSNQTQVIFDDTSITKIPIIAKTRFIAGHAKATKNSHFTGFL